MAKGGYVGSVHRIITKPRLVPRLDTHPQSLPRPLVGLVLNAEF